MSDFIEHLQALERNNDRQALAALRRGLGKKPGDAPEVYRYVPRRFLPKPHAPEDWDNDAHYLIASLFALHPQSTSEGNMGAHFAALCKSEDEDKTEPTSAVERRFNALLDSHPQDLHRTLQQAISLLKAKNGIPVNWRELLWNVRQWDDPETRRKVQRQWATSFWSAFMPRKNPPETNPVSAQ